jgi:hypothetical protein
MRPAKVIIRRDEHLNIGTGEDVTISNLARLIAWIVDRRLRGKIRLRPRLRSGAPGQPHREFLHSATSPTPRSS